VGKGTTKKREKERPRRDGRRDQEEMEEETKKRWMEGLRSQRQGRNDQPQISGKNHPETERYHSENGSRTSESDGKELVLSALCVHDLHTRETATVRRRYQGPCMEGRCGGMEEERATWHKHMRYHDKSRSTSRSTSRSRSIFSGSQ
jgi:hypothetical protein